MKLQMTNKEDLLNVCIRFNLTLEQVRSLLFLSSMQDVSFNSAFVMSQLTHGQGGSRSIYDIPDDELKSLKSRIMAQVIEQELAVKLSSNAVVKSRKLPLTREKPIGSYIFLGPTGVGKTYLAKVLAKELFQNEKALIHIDMTGYKNECDVSRLLGAPPGYIGYNEEGGLLTRLVREKKCGILLFDEFEKAHPQILDALMRIIDEGKFTDASTGQDSTVYEFIVILTSNLGTEEANRYSDEKKKQAVYFDSLRAAVRPEIINRFEEIVIFQALTEKAAVKITDLLLQKRLHEIKKIQGITLTYEKIVVEALEKIGYSPEYNARPLERTIERYIINPLCNYLLHEQIVTGDVLHMDWVDNRLKFIRRNNQKDADRVKR